MICTQVFALLCAYAFVYSEGDSNVGEAFYPSSTPGYDGDNGTPPNPPETPNRARRSSSSCTPTALTEEQQATIVDYHNARRSDEENLEGAAGMMEMEWDDDLAGPAQDWADQCNWYHGNTWGCSYSQCGQNMALRTGNSPNLDADMSAWFAEKSYYNYTDNTCSGICGHYTQMVWDKSSKIGCGFKICSSIEVSPGVSWTNAALFVCNYYLPGNWYGERPYDKGSRCTGCRDLWESPRDPFTCTSDNLCAVASEINDATCKYPCVNGARSSLDCFCECNDGYCGVSCETVYSCVHGTTFGEYGCGCDCDDGYCGQTCNTPLPDCVHGTRSGQYGCGCVCDEGYCGSSCNKQLVSTSENVQTDYNCNYWADLGYCTQVYKTYMEANCAATCGATIQVCQ